MKTLTGNGILLSTLIVLLLLAGSCTKDDTVIIKGCTDPDADNYNPDATEDDGSCVFDGGFEMADGIAGGQYYDKFYSSDTEWTTPNDPSVNITDITNYGDFYRCKQCHGWDLLGREGAYIGRAPKTSRPNVAINIKEHVEEETLDDLFNLIKRVGGRPVDTTLTQDGTTGSGDAHPDFSMIYTDAQIWDIVKFLKDEVIDVDNLYDFTTSGTYPTGSITYSNIGKDGDVANGLEYYNSNRCRNCHGADGTSRILEGDRTLGKFLRDKPYEVHHKTKFGALGTSPRMGPTETTDQEMQDVYKLMADPVAFPDDPAFGSADGIEGGKYYDKFYSSDTEWTEPSDPSVNIDDITNFGDFYRCKQCHGWDLLGREGAYAGRAPKTTRPNVAIGIREHIKEESIEDLFDLVKRVGGRPVDASLTQDGTTGSGDGHPDFSTIFTDEQIWDIVKFLKAEVLETDELYDFTVTGSYPEGSVEYSNIGKNGDADSGLAFYNDNGCSACHGADGTSISLEDRTLGEFLRDKPYEVQHKTKFGALGTSMGPTQVSIDEMRDLYKVLADTTKFPN